MARETRKERSDSNLKETLDFSASDTRGGEGPLAENALPVKLGRYEVSKLLGRGGMGSVYLARDEQLDRDVALKVPKADLKENDKARERFYREARAAAKITHPNLCPIYDVTEIDGIHCIAMAYIKGRPLSEYIDKENPQSEKVVANIVQKVALAMAEAHQNGILHRDLKPANIMIDHRKEPVVMDFGLACPSEANDESRLTQEGTLIGSPAYMPPEQLRGDSIGPATDQYALGVVLFESLSGSLPFKDSASTLTLLTHILTQEPRKLEDLRPGVDPRLCKIVERAISKDVEQRFASMKHFAAALSKFVRGAEKSTRKKGTKPVVAAAVTQPVSVEPSSSPATPAANPFDNLPSVDTDQVQTFRGPGAHRPRKTPPVLMIAAGCLLLGLILGPGLLFFMSEPSKTPVEDSEQVTETTNDDRATTAEASDAESVGEANEMDSSQDLNRGGFFKPTVNRLLRQFDTNDDGKLSESEIPELERARMMEADSNEDGFLSTEELAAMPPPPEPPGGRDRDRRFDNEDESGPRGRPGGLPGGQGNNRFGDDRPRPPGGPRNRQRGGNSSPETRIDR
ncbi:MAG: protein kinase [Planctomycetota bacterium]